ncbi:DUF2141 domain-containing protein [Paraglaciecola aquimarina]|uniref:DUF2141 domain-containing protein n=1 Tax=Paraglaciecola algarum TaxID=3050085 RepID=A0ABS9D900_9ALTE|nr:DUF2141 domain-containing protein [Paraglaciecola sp. G1-23]MCF2949408.1 DUF2141 domain-containing protein [Paraglaciecola sp. G1-23]
MKKRTFNLVALAMVMGNLHSFASEAKDIEFQIQGINSNKGKLYVQLFKGQEGYKNGQAVNASIVNAQKGEAKIMFSVIEAGEYAIRFFHDENDNGKLETNMFGMPTEGYGYSNSAKPNFGPATYQQIKFNVPTGAQKVVNKTQVIY